MSDRWEVNIERESEREMEKAETGATTSKGI